jgi:hypothetical protein
MNIQLLSQNLFGGLTPEFVLPFYVFVAIGMFLNLSTHLLYKAGKQTSTSKGFKFKPSFWLADNWLRVVAVMVAVFVFLRFFDALNTGYQLNMFLGLLLGSSFDALVVFVRNKTNVNIFQTKKTAY